MTNNNTNSKQSGNAHKGETQPSIQKGSKSTSNGKKKKHEKDESSGAAKNTTKKQGNSI